MAISLQQVLRQTQTQKLIMTPQMQQSIQLLQLNSLELEQMIHEEMMENPFLEISDDEEDLKSQKDDGAEDERRDDGPDTDSGLSDQAKEQEARKSADDDEPSERDEFADRPEAEPGVEDRASSPDSQTDSDDFEKFSQNDVDWGEEFSDSDTMSYSGTKETLEEHDFTTYTAIGVSLYDSLMRQIRLSALEGKDLEIAEFIIGNLDERGFLDSQLETMALMLKYPPDVLELKGGPKSEESLRRILVEIHGDADREHYQQLNRKQLVASVVGALLNITPDEAMAMSREQWLTALIAKRLRMPLREVRDMPHEDLLLECIARRQKTDAQRVFDVLEVVQELEPTGVGARNLGECLRLQCEEKGIRNRLLYRILDEHLGDLQQKRFREIARSLNCPEDEVMTVFHIVSRLDPRPGLAQTKDSARYITPDVYVKKMDNKYMYFLNEGDAGRLRVASNYRRMVQQKRRRNAAAAAAAAKAAPDDGTPGPSALTDDSQVQYAQEKYKNAVWLIKNIEKRKSTVLRVTEAIMDYQEDFLEKGIEHLHPLTLRNIAEVVGMHESTIARVTTGKYVETPRGIFELKFFFSSGLETESGEDASSRSIKEIITQMIDAEDLKKPLSDQKIADMLKERGVQIARRTVAKYREQLKILPAKLRKEVG